MRSSRRSSLRQTGARRAGALVATCVLSMLTATGCVTTNEAASSARNDPEYVERLDKLAKVFEERDVEKLIALYDQETYSLSFDQPWAFNSGATNHRGLLVEILGSLESLKITWEPDVEVDKTSERVWTTRHFKADAVAKSGKQTTITGWHSAIWEKRGDAVIIAYEHFNLDPKTVEPPPPPVAMAPPPPVAMAPPVLTPEAQEAQARDLIRDIFFDYDKWDIRSEDLASLGLVLDYLTKYPGTKMTIEGHCDERGSTRYNINLGQKRADATKAWLVGKGVSADRLHTISFGKSRPFQEGRSEDAWQSNRRSHFVVTKGPQLP